MANRFLGYEKERVGNLSFRLMAFILELREIFVDFEDRVSRFGIEEGFIVVDYGCGPGSYIRKASELVGPGGRVYAVDVHELAISRVERRFEALGNVAPVLARGYPSAVPASSADLIYAMDMFHMVKNPEAFLGELRRIVKPDGRLLLEPGHQPMEAARRKIEVSGVWSITREAGRLFHCTPIEVTGAHQRAKTLRGV